MIRAFATADTSAVLALIEADRITGQPHCCEAMLLEALAGRSTVDRGWWLELTDLHVDVATADDGSVIGAVSYATRTKDGTGLVLWLHAGEVPSAITTLVNHALAALAGTARQEAFAFASALTLGLEGLPVRHRPETHRALLEAGFTGTDLWRYMHRPITSADTARPTAKVKADLDDRRWTVKITRLFRKAAEAQLGMPVGGVSVLWWIEVSPRYRGKGLGRAVLTQALAHAARNDTQEVILFVDDDDKEPNGPRDRTAANHMYGNTGFTEIDRLYSYLRIAA
jgi:ribosomal protein S18 acetylase RimI-like enzyme